MSISTRVCSHSGFSPFQKIKRSNFPKIMTFQESLLCGKLCGNCGKVEGKRGEGGKGRGKKEVGEGGGKETEGRTGGTQKRNRQKNREKRRRPHAGDRSFRRRISLRPPVSVCRRRRLQTETGAAEFRKKWSFSEIYARILPPEFVKFKLIP